MTSPLAIRFSNAVFAYRSGPAVLDIADFRVEAGERVFLEGPSGSGKSTLLGLVGGILMPTGGVVEVLGEQLADLGPSRRDRFRADRVGFVFQMFNLLPYLSLVDNVLLPCRFSAARAAAARSGSESAHAEAVRLLERLGLAGKAFLERSVTELSIGQQQRVALARALIGGPSLIVADEPTSSLDAPTRLKFVDLLLEECSRAGSTVVFVSHDPSLASSFERSVRMADINTAPLEVRDDAP